MPTDRAALRRRLNRLAYEQRGYFTAAQALAVGYSYQAQKHHVDRGNWVRVGRGMFRLPDRPADAHDSFVRWGLWSGGRGVVSHESALEFYGLSDLDPATIHLTVRSDFYAKDDAVTLHVASLPEADVIRQAGWAVTTPQRSLIDVAAGEVSQEHVTAAVRDAVAQGLVTRRRLREASDEGGSTAALRIERAISEIEASE